MPARRKLDTLPKDLLAQLDAKLLTNGFADSRGLSQWLKEQGYSIGKDPILRRGQELERNLEAIRRSTEQARAIVAASPDDEGAMNDALIRLVQEINFKILIKLQDAGLDAANDEEGQCVDPKALGGISRSVALLVRASVRQKEWMTEVRSRLKAQVAAAESRIAEVASSNGVSHETAQAMRNALLDIHV
jgi:hypothetical protein